MTTAYSALMGLALPVQGELTGTWGDTVNNGITRYLDAALAGTQEITGTQTAVTLSLTNGDAAATNLSQVGAGATGSAQYAVINCTGSPASTLVITAPASSRNYIVINATSTSQDVQIVAAGPTTGVTIPSGGRAFVAWNGSDFVLIGGNVTTTGTQTLTNKRVTPRSVDIASASTITPTSDTADQYEVTALAVPATIASPSGTPTDGQKLVLRFKDNGTGRALTWTTGSSGSYRAIGVTLPTTTVANKTMYVGCIYNVADSRWDVVAVGTEA